MSEDQSILRTTLLGSLLDVARHNVARGQGVRGFYESGAVYRATGERLPHEHRALAALVPGDVFAAKAYVEAVLGVLRVEATLRGRGAAVPASRPQRRRRRRRHRLGWVGDVHPLVAAEWDLDGVAAFELDLDAVIAHAAADPRLRGPHVVPRAAPGHRGRRRRRRPGGAVLDVVRAAGGRLLARAEVFDVYRGEQIAAGRTSLAIALTFRARDRTLTDDDVAPVREKIVARLAQELGGELRG